jgi:hypothetical protein
MSLQLGCRLVVFAGRRALGLIFRAENRQKKGRGDSEENDASIHMGISGKGLNKPDAPTRKQRESFVMSRKRRKTRSSGNGYTVKGWTEGCPDRTFVFPL